LYRFRIEQEETEVTEQIVSASLEPWFERDSVSRRKYHVLPKATGFFEGDRFSGGGWFLSDRAASCVIFDNGRSWRF
jgi:hypothetical protein